jgi:2'-5' RNA ligase
MSHAPPPADPALRLFFALVPPAPLRHALATLGATVATAAHGRAVAEANLHVTVAFIGAWPATGLEHWTAIGAQCGGARFRLRLDSLGGFRRARVAWIGARASPPALADVVQALATALARTGVAQDTREFRPHLTLARHCRGPFPAAAAGPYEWDVDTLTLMASRAEPAGVRYVETARWSLS